MFLGSPLISVKWENLGLDWDSLTQSCPWVPHRHSFSCQMTLFNGLRRSPYVDLTSDSLMIHAFIPFGLLSALTVHLLLLFKHHSPSDIRLQLSHLVPSSQLQPHPIPPQAPSQFCVPRVSYHLIQTVSSWRKRFPFFLFVYFSNPSAWLQTQWAFTAEWDVNKRSGKKLCENKRRLFGLETQKR